ncbi:transcription factor Dp-1-like [Artemia franciscana]|uniref:Transcription factor Dp-1 n=1 Tax=Artemia franciscana TaxID=6661 RepID=A0AA88L603_ARTSF|nr:hypothetical protein QYM36_005340 [Artemia franciscana]
MSQQASNGAPQATTLWVQDSNGQPQMVKVIRASAISGITSQNGSQPIRVIRTHPSSFNQTGTQIVQQSRTPLASSNRPVQPSTQGQPLPVKVLRLQTPQKTPVKAPNRTGSGESGIYLPHGETIDYDDSSMLAASIEVASTDASSRAPSPAFSTASSVSQHVYGKRRSIWSPEMISQSYIKNLSGECYETIDMGPEIKKRRMDKTGKGLRYFSMVVCEKVQKKGSTSYNEVADELVNEFLEQAKAEGQIHDQYDQKNIRRRVYDALNVLMAMNIIAKEKKEIRWLGLPANAANECAVLEERKKKLVERIRTKTQQLQDLIIQQIAYKQLVKRNKEREAVGGPPLPQAVIHLPFIIVSTNRKTVIDCSISNDKTEYLFNFDDAFEIHDDIEVMKRMGLTLGLDQEKCAGELLVAAKNCIPKSLEDQVERMASGDTNIYVPEVVHPGIFRAGGSRSSGQMSSGRPSDDDYDDHSD